MQCIVPYLDPDFKKSVGKRYVCVIEKERQKNTKRDRDTRDREEERRLVVLDPAVPEAGLFLQMGYASQ